MKWWIICAAVINIVTFLVYGFDKWRAKRDGWRVPEKTLLLLAVFGGSVGAIIGMRVFCHKTKKLKFSVGIPAIIILQALLIYLIFLGK